MDENETQRLRNEIQRLKDEIQRLRDTAISFHRKLIQCMDERDRARDFIDTLHLTPDEVAASEAALADYDPIRAAILFLCEQSHGPHRGHS